MTTASFAVRMLITSVMVVLIALPMRRDDVLNFIAGVCVFVFVGSVFLLIWSI